MREILWPLVLIPLFLPGCAGAPTARGGEARLEAGASAGSVDTGAEALSKAPKLDRTTADSVHVTATYGALDATVARLGIIGGLVFLGLLLGAAAAPDPGDARLVVCLYAASGASFVAALVLSWRFFVT